MTGPCASFEALEGVALRLGEPHDGGGDASDAWLEAHVGECAACAAELDRLLEERSLFVDRAQALGARVSVPDVAAVFALLDRRRERVRRSGVLASMVATAAACIALAFTPMTSPKGWTAARAAAEPATADLGAVAWQAYGRGADDAPMTPRVAACMPTMSAAPSESESAACASPAEPFGASGALSALASGGPGASASMWTIACVADVTCSVARP